MICGGTNYYIESVLWKVLVDYNNDANGSGEGSTIEPVSKLGSEGEHEDDPRSTSELYEALKAVDPDRSQELHPHERRKILRSLKGVL